MRLPNGYGSVYKLSGTRRNPWIARKTIGWDENGKQLYQTIGYYEKRQLALEALTEYNTNPYSIETSTITFTEVFDMWKDNKFEGVSKTSINSYNAAYKECTNLYKIKFVDIKSKHMADVIKNSDKGYGSKRKIKVLFNQLFKFAMENDIVVKDYSDYVMLGKNTEESKRKVFTKEEIKRLFDVVNEVEYADTILIMIYTGLRIGELLIIKNTDIDIEKGIITGGIKTDAGKDRIIPISNKIIKLIENRMSQGYEYLVVNNKGEQMKYNNYYREKFTPTLIKLNLQDHTPHDCRHTFATMMSDAGADTIALQKIIGHADYQTTANIYTHKDIEQLRKAIDLI